MAKYPTTEMCNGALLEAFEPTARDDDVFCATAAKCGQTWLLTLMHHLKTRGRDPELGGRGMFQVVPWLEHPVDMGHTFEKFEIAPRLAQLEALGDPRLFKMHVLFEEIPRPPGCGAKIVTIYRDARDLPYSMYRHIAALHDDRRLGDAPPSFDAYFERWLDFGYVFTHLAGFWPRRDDPDVLILRYEDLKRDLRANAERLVEFLGWSLDEKDLERALPLVDFEHMRATEHVALRSSKPAFKDGEQFFREGKIGKNRARLSAEQEARVVAKARETLPPDAFEFLMSQS